MNTCKCSDRLHFRMWSDEELLKLSDVITMVDINQICTKEELEIIGFNSTRLNNLKSEIRVPKHTRNVRFLPLKQFVNFIQPKTITVKQLWYEDCDLYQWLKSIGESIRFQDLVCWIGFSYLMIKPAETSEPSIVYNYAAKELNLSMTKLDSEVI